MIRPLAAAALAALILPIGSRARAQTPRDTTPWFHMPPIVVTANRGETPSQTVASSITVIDRVQIERRQYRTVEEALRDVPGVHVARNGGLGGVASVFLRGAESDHTLVLVDGVEVNDPASPAGTYDFSLLPAHDVERIEVLRGPQSTLYGSAAMGGVVHVITRRGDGPGRGTLQAEGGSRDASRVEATASGGTGRVTAFASLAYRRTDGISATAPRFGGTEADGAESTSFAGRADWRYSDGVGLGVVVRFRADDTELDQGGFEGGDDPNFTGESEELSVRAEGRFGLLGGRWNQTLAGTLARIDRSTQDEADAARPEDRSSGEFEGSRWKAEWLHRVAAAGGRLTGGLETEVERARSRFESASAFGPFENEFPEEFARTTGAFVQHEGELGGRLAWAVGARVDAHERFGTAATWRVAPLLELGAGTRVRAAIGTGFQAPSLFQLFDPEFGDPDLEPEKSRGWEAGVERDLAGGRVRLAATWFSSRFEEMIAFEFPGGYRNQDSADTRGVEATASAWVTEDLHLRAAYTHTRSEDDAGAPRVRRPRHLSQLTAAWNPGRAALAVTARFVGEREDLDFSALPAARVTLDGWTDVRTAASWRVHERVGVFGRIENLLDEEREEVLGFGAPGRAFHAGASADF